MLRVMEKSQNLNKVDLVACRNVNVFFYPLVTRGSMTICVVCCRHFCVFSFLILETGGIFNCPGRLPMQMDLPATSPHIFIMFMIHSSSSLPHISIILAHILTKSIRFWRGKTWSKGDGGPDNYYNKKTIEILLCSAERRSGYDWRWINRHQGRRRGTFPCNVSFVHASLNKDRCITLFVAIVLWIRNFACWDHHPSSNWF